MARKQRRTLAVVAHKLEDVVSSMQSDAIYFSAYYDNKTHVEFVAEKINEIVTHYGRVLGWWQIKKFENDYKLGVVVYATEEVAEKDRKRGVDYERYCF